MMAWVDGGTGTKHAGCEHLLFNLEPLTSLVTHVTHGLNGKEKVHPTLVKTHLT